LYCYFFFQAEDGIRDRNVTGVQTCALPIWCDPAVWQRNRRLLGVGLLETCCRNLPVQSGARQRGIACAVRLPDSRGRRQPSVGRSEERRVGKEWRSRRAREQWREKRKEEGI